MESHLLLVSVLVPSAASMILLLLGRGGGRAHSLISAASLGTSLASILAAVAASFPAWDSPIVFGSPIGSFGFVVDQYSLPFVLGVLAVSILVALYSKPYMEKRFAELGGGSWSTYYSAYTLFAASMLGVALSSNMIEFYLFLEISLITSFLLIALYGYGERIRVAFLYFIWTHAGAFLFLVGSFIYGLSKGSFDYIIFSQSGISYPFNGSSGIVDQGLRIASFALILLGLLVKLPALGFHIWLPYAHAEAPTPVSALLSPNLVGLAGLGLYRILVILYPGEMIKYQWVLITWALLTIIYGGILALYQDDFKRLLAYSSISQMGYIFLGLSTMTPAGVAGALLHYLSHAFGKASLFMSAGNIIVMGHGLRSISRMGGLARSMPLTAASSLTGFLTISGLPPTIGVVSKFFIIAGTAQLLFTLPGIGVGAVSAAVVAIIAGFGLTIAYSFIAMKRIYFGGSGILVPEDPEESRPGLGVTTMLVGVLSIAALLLSSYIATPLSGVSELLREVFSPR